MGDRRRSPLRGPPGGGGRGGRLPPERGGYKVLCVSALHPKASDDVVRDTLYREYKKYGDISVRVMHEPDERVAYVYFRNFEDARDAKHSKSRIILFDKPATVEAVYESASREEYESRGSSRPHSLSPPRYRDHMGGGGYGRPRTPERYREDLYHHRDDYMDRRGGGPLPPLRGPRRDDFRGPMGGGLRGGGHFRDDYRGPPPMHHRGGMRGGGGGGYVDHYAQPLMPRRDNKKDKFPNYMDHLPPEEDPLATRTLFAGEKL
jgi:RNA-binding protein 15